MRSIVPFGDHVPRGSTEGEVLCIERDRIGLSLRWCIAVRAVRIDRFGPPDVLKLACISAPAPRQGEILVGVSAAGVGPWDALIRNGESALARQLPITLGSDFAGKIVQFGSGAGELHVGDDVFGSTVGFVGAYAEFVVVPQNMVAPKPASLDFIEAAAIPVVAVTALQMVNRAGCISGRTVLVHGAAGAVGSFVVQLAGQNGARVIANAASADEEHVRAIGAETVVDIRVVGFGAIREPVDVVFDTVGGEVQRGSFDVLKRGGILISVVSPPDEVTAQRYAVNAQFFYVDVNTLDLQIIARAFDAKTLRVNVGTVLPLADARIAHEMMAGDRSHPRGKIVLRVLEGERAGVSA
jgi:NADPH:quinone reductase-like Zn-dependent oxidoreductase